MQSIWNQRVKLIDKSALTAMNMYGTTKAIASNTIKKINALEVPSIELLESIKDDAS